MNIKKYTYLVVLILLCSLKFLTIDVRAATNVSAPTSVKVKTDYKGDPEITWKKVSGAIEYRVYRKTSTSSSWVKIATVKENTYIDEKWIADSSSAVQYAVSAYVKKGNTKVWSEKSKAVKWKVPAYSKGLEYELNRDGTEYWVVGIGKCTDIDIIFPTRYQGLPVTRIENFSELPDINSVKLSASITEIGKLAFRLCTGLTEIVIPKTVKKIDINPFADCNNIISIIVDEENPYYNSKNDCNAIIETASNTLITGCGITIIPKGIKRIGDYSFYGYDTLAAINLPSGLVGIGDNAFRGCINLNNVKIPNSVTSIGKGAFAECSNLTKISLPNDLTKISAFTFFECNNLQSISIPESVTVIDEFAFRNCKSLKKIFLPKGITEIYPYSLSGCESLTEIDIPDGVTRIEYNAFFECLGLTSVKIPDSVTYVGEEAFRTCKSLTSIDIPYGTTKIKEQTFAGCMSLKEVNLPDSVTKIDDLAFIHSGITDLPNMKNVTSIGFPPFWIHKGLNIRVVKGSYADIQLREYGYSDYMSYID